MCCLSFTDFPFFRVIDHATAGIKGHHGHEDGGGVLVTGVDIGIGGLAGADALEPIEDMVGAVDGGDCFGFGGLTGGGVSAPPCGGRVFPIPACP